MTDGARSVQRTYLLLTLLSTLAASFIWGINTLFLLDAGLSNTEAFAANAFFALGQVVFEVPTGVVADTVGRRASYLLGAGTLLVSTLIYLLMWQLEAPLWGWAIASLTIGLGFTFFSGAVEAWLVDALAFTQFEGSLESVFAKGQVVTGGAMLTGSIAGGFIAQATNLGVPYVVRAGVLGATLVTAWLMMKDIGFTPERSAGPIAEVRRVAHRVGGRRVAQAPRPLADAGFAVLDGCGHLRVLCDAALPAGAVRERAGVRRCRYRCRRRRRRPDRRRARGAVGAADVSAQDRCAAPRRSCQHGGAARHRPHVELRGCHRTARRLGAHLLGHPADAPGVPQRPHPLTSSEPRSCRSMR